MAWTPEKRAEASRRTREWLEAGGRSRLSSAQKVRWHQRKEAFAKEETETVAHPIDYLLSRPASCWTWDCYHWSNQEIADLRVLRSSNIERERAATILSRPVSSVIEKALAISLPFPRANARQGPTIIIRKPRPQKSPIARKAAHELMHFPFALKETSGNADILAINALVPRGMPEFMRADICQNIMLAVLEGETTLDRVKREGIRKYTGAYRRDYEINRAISLDAPLGGSELRLIDVLADDPERQWSDAA